MELIFWKNILCHLQSSYIRELASTDGTDVTVVVETEMERDRAQQGWLVPDYGRAKIVVNPDRGQIRKIINNSSADSIHILNGYRSWRLLEDALKELLRSDRRFGLLSEPGVSVGWKGLLGPAMYRAHSLLFWRRFDFIFAMGLRGADWFHARGYPRQKLFPFAYITESYAQLTPSLPDHEGPVHIVFVGQLVRRKGIDLALRALHGLPSESWRLSVIGTGPLRNSLEALAKRLSLEGRVSFLGAMRNAEVARLLQTADLLLLPSRYDGWGAVSNEALMCGVPVICSSQCGSKDLLGEAARGEVFPFGSVKQLRTALRKRIVRGTLKSHEREQIRNWSVCISGQSAAHYFFDVLHHVYGQSPRPTPPWL
jgi:glycosyltransferase involved in cell wall biosynthesis